VSSYLIVIESGKATNYSAYCPDLPGDVATGATAEECADEMREAIRFHTKECVKLGSPFLRRPVGG
jgi:predicted RNase H-like HicB family nuclease